MCVCVYVCVCVCVCVRACVCVFAPALEREEESLAHEDSARKEQSQEDRCVSPCFRPGSLPEREQMQPWASSRPGNVSPPGYVESISSVCRCMYVLVCLYVQFCLRSGCVRAFSSTCSSVWADRSASSADQPHCILSPAVDDLVQQTLRQRCCWRRRASRQRSRYARTSAHHTLRVFVSQLRQ